ncbi:hypothetical protein MBAV_002180 [Candidatus Magnetobacterium bavaricum]|uniref:Uncharacterized protein n=1 Tax=Candidatus Magnetobacterium bavaricum TaxID=29290 RepID=A0A0F3GUS0_9BACT|nr:hypothetical protein MBAV_002180 [Candidatus Magnetobacterium bavaricum]
MFINSIEARSFVGSMPCFFISPQAMCHPPSDVLSTPMNFLPRRSFIPFMSERSALVKMTPPKTV